MVSYLAAVVDSCCFLWLTFFRGCLFGVSHGSHLTRFTVAISFSMLRLSLEFCFSRPTAFVLYPASDHVIFFLQNELTYTRKYGRAYAGDGIELRDVFVRGDRYSSAADLSVLVMLCRVH